MPIAIELERIIENMALSSNGRTPDSQSDNKGSLPFRVTKFMGNYTAYNPTKPLGD